jgi:outer membrane protein assembly factor BamB
VVALNATDGSTAWTASASPSDATAGVAATLGVRAGTVFYLDGAGSPSEGTARVVARAASSGKVVWQSAAGDFDTWPSRA